MNDEASWRAAPCVRSYARNLKLFMDQLVDDGVVQRTLPLIYAEQDSSVLGGAETNSDTIVKLTADYLTCAETGKGTIVEDVAGDGPTHGIRHFKENRFGISPIDIIGINIESWCSSTQDFWYNPDGTRGSYFSLWSALQETSVPVIFTEMGCPHKLFDRDDPEHKTVAGTRDWAQIEFVVKEMRDTWAGFIAYTYDGENNFAMFEGGPWDGRHLLQPTQDFFNFKEQLDKIPIDMAPFEQERDNVLPRRCSAVEADFISCCDLRLFNDDKIHTFALKSAMLPVDVEVHGFIQQIKGVSSSGIVTKSFCSETWFAGLILVSLSMYFIFQRRSVTLNLSNLQERSSLRPCGKTNYGSSWARMESR
jgi:hypothetical protein